MLILVCGDRNWKSRSTIAANLSEYQDDTTLIHGGCRGEDIMSEDYAKTRGWKVIRVDADWSLGLRAGPVRNRKMLDMKPDKVIAFHLNIHHSKGTRDCVKEAKRREIRIEMINWEE